VPWPNEKVPLAFFEVRSHEIVDCESKANPKEAQQLVDLVERVLQEGELGVEDIGVVTPYTAQVRQLRRLVAERLPKNQARFVEIASVDNFQGREKELILFSAVRSNNYGNVGFLADWRRLNVMLTRARRGLVVFGAARTLQCDKHWQQWLEWCEGLGACGRMNRPTEELRWGAPTRAGWDEEQWHNDDGSYKQGEGDFSWEEEEDESSAQVVSNPFAAPVSACPASAGPSPFAQTPGAVGGCTMANPFARSSSSSAFAPGGQVVSSPFAPGSAAAVDLSSPPATAEGPQASPTSKPSLDPWAHRGHDDSEDRAARRPARRGLDPHEEYISPYFSGGPEENAEQTLPFNLDALCSAFSTCAKV